MSKTFVSDSVGGSVVAVPSGHDTARPLFVLRFADWEFGDKQHTAIKEWLTANGIPLNQVPVPTRFVITDGDHPKIQITLFQLQDGRKLVSLYGNGFVKFERTFDMVAPLDQFGVETLPVGEAFNMVDGPPPTKDEIRQIVDERVAELRSMTPVDVQKDA